MKRMLLVLSSSRPLPQHFGSSNRVRADGGGGSTSCGGTHVQAVNAPRLCTSGESGVRARHLTKTEQDSC